MVIRLTPVTTEAAAHLVADDVIDHAHPLVRGIADGLRAGAPDELGYARAAFEFVRDAVPHSVDSGDRRIPWRASEVLGTRNGICHAKSHALVALLRAEGIQAGFCYQRLNVLHGLVAVRMPGTGRWVRQDPRGNTAGIDAQFRTEREQLAHPVRPSEGECDYPVLHPDPHPVVLRALREARDHEHLWELLDTTL